MSRRTGETWSLDSSGDAPRGIFVSQLGSGKQNKTHNNKRGCKKYKETKLQKYDAQPL